MNQETTLFTVLVLGVKTYANLVLGNIDLIISVILIDLHSFMKLRLAKQLKKICASFAFCDVDIHLF